MANGILTISNQLPVEVGAGGGSSYMHVCGGGSDDAR